MELTGEHRIAAPAAKVWRALNDPRILKKCIPGCQSMKKISATKFTATVRTKIGPVSAKFACAVTLSDLDPPRSYTISGEGKGGVAGFAKGSARVTLEAEGAATVLRYVADAKVGGKLAQLGSRLIAGTARRLAERFFGTFAETVAPGSAAHAAREER